MGLDSPDVIAKVFRSRTELRFKNEEKNFELNVGSEGKPMKIFNFNFYYLLSATCSQNERIVCFQIKSISCLWLTQSKEPALACY